MLQTLPQAENVKRIFPVLRPARTHGGEARTVGETAGRWPRQGEQTGFGRASGNDLGGGSLGAAGRLGRVVGRRSQVGRDIDPVELLRL